MTIDLRDDPSRCQTCFARSENSFATSPLSSQNRLHLLTTFATWLFPTAVFRLDLHPTSSWIAKHNQLKLPHLLDIQHFCHKMIFFSSYSWRQLAPCQGAVTTPATNQGDIDLTRKDYSVAHSVANSGSCFCLCSFTKKYQTQKWSADSMSLFTKIHRSVSEKDQAFGSPAAIWSCKPVDMIVLSAVQQILYQKIPRCVAQKNMLNRTWLCQTHVEYVSASSILVLRFEKE